LTVSNDGYEVEIGFLASVCGRGTRLAGGAMVYFVEAMAG
jgi:hypothetical protein